MGAKASKKAAKPGQGRPPAGAPPTRRKTLAWIVAACLIPVLLVGFALYTKGLTEKAWNAVVDYKSPYLFPLESGPATGSPATGGVLLIIVDGLRLDNSKKLDTWNAARAGSGAIPAGADLSAVTGQPSLSDPAAAVIPSGTSQEVHGVTTNWYEGQLMVDNLFKAARRSSKTTAVVAGKGWVDLYGDSIDHMYKFDDSTGDYDKQVFEQTMAILEAAKDPTHPEPLPDLLVVHFGGVDNASHEFGGLSPEALEAAKTIDAYIGQILGAYDLSSRTAILTSDHGHIATGGHGGWESDVITTPLVFTGKAVNPGPKPAAKQVDIAPTIAALLGMSMPAETVGTILDNVVAVPPEDLAKAFIDLGRTRYAFSKEYFKAVTEGMGPSEVLATAETSIEDGNGMIDQAWTNLVAGNPVLAVGAAKAGLYLMDEARAKIRDARLGAERQARLPWSLALALLPLLPLLYLGRNRWANLALAGAALYFVAYNVLFFMVHGLRFSLSIFNEESLIQQFFNTRMLEAALVVAVMGLLMGLWAGWRRSYNGPELAEGGAILAYLVSYGLELQIVLFYALYGVSFDWYIPNLAWGYKFYSDCLQAVPTGLASVLVVPLVLVGAKLAAVISGGRSATQPVNVK